MPGDKKAALLGGLAAYRRSGSEVVRASITYYVESA
jgi:hypothetical protein